MYLWGLCLRMSFCFGKSLQSRYFKFSIGFLHLAQRPFWAAPLLRRSSVLPKAKPRRRANSLRPSNLKNPRYPKKKHLLCRCFFFGIPRQSRYFQTLSDKFPMWDCRTYLSYNEVQGYQIFEYRAAQISLAVYKHSLLRSGDLSRSITLPCFFFPAFEKYLFCRFIIC